MPELRFSLVFTTELARNSSLCDWYPTIRYFRRDIWTQHLPELDRKRKVEGPDRRGKCTGCRKAFLIIVVPCKRQGPGGIEHLTGGGSEEMKDSCQLISQIQVTMNPDTV